MASKLIPRSFQSPNWYVDHLAHLLTPQEQVVLNKAVREILGWHNKIESRKARIALSVFTEGKFSRETGERLAYGCGLKTGAVRTALKALDQYRILVKVGDPTQDGQLFQLQDNDQKIDLLGLNKRLSKKNTANARKTKSARAKRKGVMSDNTPNVGQQGGGDVEQYKGVMSDNNKETQEKPKRNPHFAQGASETPQESLEEKPVQPQEELQCSDCPNEHGYVLCEKCTMRMCSTCGLPVLTFNHARLSRVAYCTCPAQEELCPNPDCNKPLRTSKQTPRREDCCPGCQSEQALVETFGPRAREPAMPEIRHYSERAADPWANLSDGQFKLRLNASVEVMDHVLYLVRDITNKWPTSSQWKHWNTQCGEIYEAGGGDWDAIEQGITDAWARESRYRPGDIRGFVNPVSNAFAATKTGAGGEIGIFDADEVQMV